MCVCVCNVFLDSQPFTIPANKINKQLCGRIDVEDFKALLEADHLFCAHPQHTHPAAGRVARLLSQQLSRQLSRSVSQSQQQRRGSVVLVNVADLLRRGSSVLVDRWDGEVGDGDGGQEDV